MLGRSLILVFLILFSGGCARTYLATPGKIPIAITKVTQTRLMPSFNDVFIQGRINVSLHTGYVQPKILIRGDSRDLAQLNISVSNNRLVVFLLDAYPQHGPINIDIRTRHLNSITYKGAGLVEGRHIKSGLLDLFITNPGKTILGGNINLGHLEINGSGYLAIQGVRSSNLQLTVKGNPTIQLRGMVNLSHLDLLGDAKLSLYWVKSDWLTIRGHGHSVIELAGIVNKLDLELWDYARFKGRYLRAKRLFAKTHQRSVAELIATKRQHTLASDASDIYFYEIPDMRTDLMIVNGAVLDMRDLNNPFIEEYTRYNR